MTPKHLSAARRQRGLFTYDQAVTCGYAAEAVWRFVQQRRWEEVQPFVYRALPVAPLSWEQRVLALVLSTDGAAFGRSAFALHGLLQRKPPPEVLVVRAAETGCGSGCTARARCRRPTLRSSTESARRCLRVQFATRPPH